MSKRVIDKQTGEFFYVIQEKKPDRFAARVSIIYTLAVLGYLSWLLLDTWTGEYPFWLKKAYPGSLTQLNYPIFKLVIYTALGGGMGAAVNNIRSFVYWHSELNAFGKRFFWKYVSMPPLGAVLAVMVYAIIRGGTTLISGSPSGEVLPATSLAAWVMGALAGYGSGKVLIWLDDKVNTLFKVETKAGKVPDLTGKTQDEAEQLLKGSNLVLGDVSEQQTSEPTKIDKVISQTPVPGTEAASGSSVVITLGKEMGQAPRVSVPNLTGKTQGEAAQTLTDGKLALGGVSTALATDVQLIGKVITQSPLSGAEVAPDSKVGITVGKKMDSEPAKMAVPDLTGKSQEEAAQTLKDGKLALGDVSTLPTNDEQLIDKVITQTPSAGTETAPDSTVAIIIGKASDV
jgi:beta-lactam-binding protein with PASTA domain